MRHGGLQEKGGDATDTLLQKASEAGVAAGDKAQDIGGRVCAPFSATSRPSHDCADGGCKHRHFIVRLQQLPGLCQRTAGWQLLQYPRLERTSVMLTRRNRAQSLAGCIRIPGFTFRLRQVLDVAAQKTDQATDIAARKTNEAADRAAALTRRKGRDLMGIAAEKAGRVRNLLKRHLRILMRILTHVGVIRAVCIWLM